MTRSELIACMARHFPHLLIKDIEISVKEILNHMSQTMVAGQRIEIRGFGSFGISYRAPRAGRNPKTGAKVAVPGKFVPYFRAGKELRERVDQAG